MLLFNNYHTSYLEDTCPKEDVAKKVYTTKVNLSRKSDNCGFMFFSVPVLTQTTQYDLKDVLLAKIKQEYSVTDKNLVKVTQIMDTFQIRCRFSNLDTC